MLIALLDKSLGAIFLNELPISQKLSRVVARACMRVYNMHILLCVSALLSSYFP